MLLDPFLDAAATEATIELDRAWKEREPAGGFRASVLGCDDPLERRAVARAWTRAEDAVAHRRRARREVLDAAARTVGCASCFELTALTAPIPPLATVAATLRAAIEPRDGAIAAGAAERRARFRPRLPEIIDPSDTTLLAALADHRDRLDTRAVTRRIRAVARVLDFDPDGKGPALLDGAGRFEETRAFEWLRPRPALATGSLDGPAGLAAGLEALGRACRARVTPSPAESDPAFAAAAGLLFRRLALSERFLSWSEIEKGTQLRDDLRFEEVARMRLAWARAELAGRGLAGAGPVVEETLARATGRSPSPDLVAATWDAGANDAASLRGAAFAVLLEERLRTRSGHLWFEDERSPKFLREVWNAEEGETAESVADALDLGTMDALLLYDGYRV